MRSGRDAGDRTDGPVPQAPELAAAAVPEPRPEVLARVLAGLRDLPDAPTSGERTGAPGPRHDDGAARGGTLPRRRT